MTRRPHHLLLFRGRRSCARWLALFGVALLLPAAVATADELHLRNGSVLEGTIVRETEVHYLIRVAGIGEQRIPRDQVVRVERSETPYGEYLARRKAVDEGDAEARYRLGRWCEEHGFAEEAKAEFEAAIEADPDHSGARRKLGFARFEEQWVPEEDLWRHLDGIPEREKDLFRNLALYQMISNPKAHFRFQRPAVHFEMVVRSNTRFFFPGPEFGGSPVWFEFQATPPGGSLDEMERAVAKSVREAHEKATRREPEKADLLGHAARLLVFDYVREGLPAGDLHVERHDLIATTPQGNFRFAMECRAGYWGLLGLFFDRIVGTFEFYD